MRRWFRLTAFIMFLAALPSLQCQDGDHAKSVEQEPVAWAPTRADIDDLISKSLSRALSSSVKRDKKVFQDNQVLVLNTVGVLGQNDGPPARYEFGVGALPARGDFESSPLSPRER